MYSRIQRIQILKEKSQSSKIHQRICLSGWWDSDRYEQVWVAFSSDWVPNLQK